MKAMMENDLIALSDAIEHLQKLYETGKLALPDKVDVGARINAVGKTIEELLKGMKDDFSKALKGKEGAVLGGVFKADRIFVATDRFDQKGFSEAEPELFNSYKKDASYYMVTFKVR